jgi:hypothetical protein
MTYILNINEKEALRGTYEEIDAAVCKLPINKDTAIKIMDGLGGRSTPEGWVEVYEEELSKEEAR